MSTISDLMKANLLDVFDERDRDRRRAAIARTYAEDVVFYDPDGVLTGRAALEEKVQQLLDGAPGFVFRPGGPLHESHDMGILAWDFGPEGQPPVVTGIDVGLVRDGLLASVHTVLTSAPPPG
ncbi:MAG: nuclear transport factor 2 family protein [Pseudonocardia sp.]|nr:nuclear transport factor 2 family protein [Pseudonocardia sp.]